MNSLHGMTPLHGATTPDGPTRPTDRLDYLDTLRGFAVMAIFIVNIKAMGMPFAYYSNGALWATDLNQWIASIQMFLVDDKWRTIFTALYGAGLVLIGDRMDARDAGGGRLYTRNFWLMVFGAIHLLLIWGGDILFVYGLVGLIAMQFRRMRARGLFVWGLILLVLGLVWSSLFEMGPAFSAELRAELEPFLWGTDPTALADDIAAMRGGFVEQTAARWENALGYIGFYYLIGGHWLLTLGNMVVGMALFRAGFLRGEWGAITTLVIAIIALAISYGLDAFQIDALAASGNDFGKAVMLTPIAAVDGFAGALGYAALVSSLMAWGLRLPPVAAVGRMAFTNYIACSLIGTTLAGGHAFGLYGSFALTELMGIVIATFVAMLIWSPLWLSVFAFGPLEWLWRSLTYGRLQPLRRRRA
jgi:uncharacterized protein